MNACVDGDRKAREATLADRAVLELPLGEPGTFFVADAGNVADFCNNSGDSGHIASLNTFPAGGHVLFASFRQDGDRPHLVMIDMSGSRISRLRDFTADSERVKRYAPGLPRTHSKEPT